MSQNEALALLRSLVAHFNRSERLALAVLLVGQCNPGFGQVIGGTDLALDGGLDVALATINDFPQKQKLAFAIELLQYQLSQDEEEGGDGLLNRQFTQIIEVQGGDGDGAEQNALVEQSDCDEHSDDCCPDCYGVPYD